jgi:predicted nucleic acid-binding protein
MILTPDNEYAAVLDACVLVPMPLCDTLLRLAEEPAFYRPLWSQQILQEVGDALENGLKLTRAQRERRIAFMEANFPECLVSVPAELLTIFDCMPDPKDRHVLAAAVCGHANAIVTQNVRHFPPECLERYAMLCQTPDDFLIHQFHLNPSLILDKLDTQAAAISQSRPNVMVNLKPIAPNFVALVDQYLAG